MSPPTPQPYPAVFFLRVAIKVQARLFRLVGLWASIRTRTKPTVLPANTLLQRSTEVTSLSTYPERAEVCVRAKTPEQSRTRNFVLDRNSPCVSCGFFCPFRSVLVVFGVCPQPKTYVPLGNRRPATPHTTTGPDVTSHSSYPEGVEHGPLPPPRIAERAFKIRCPQRCLHFHLKYCTCTLYFTKCMYEAQTQ